MLAYMDTLQTKMPAEERKPMASSMGGSRAMDCYRRVVARPVEVIKLASEVHASFRNAMAAVGINPPQEIVANGKFHRFSPEGRRGDHAGWYIAHQDEIFAGAFGCWRRGLSMNWSSKSERAMTVAERESYRARVHAMKAMRDAEVELCQKNAQDIAGSRWSAAMPATQPPYLHRKGVQAWGARLERDKLLIPLCDAEGVMWCLQTINAQGEKRFQAGGRVQGCFHLVGHVADKMLICEGFATGASLHAATGLAVAVAFTAGNLVTVARAIRTKYPEVTIIVAADDDVGTEGNPGMKKAEEAAAAVGGYLTKPVTDWQGFGKGLDFNDLHQMDGLDAIRKCVDDARPRSNTAQADADSPRRSVIIVNGSDLTPQPVRWLWKDWLAAGKLHILAGPPGQGKTTIALTLAAGVTSGGCWPDGTACPIGNVIIWSGEDDPADTLLPRLQAAGADPNRCFFVTGTTIGGDVQSFDPARDMTALEQQAKGIGGVKLLVIDPVVSAVAGDGNKNNEVRRALQPLVDLASRLGAAVVGISHFSKGGAGADPASRVVGSVAFAAVARVVLVAAKVTAAGGVERRILARSKSNIGPDNGGFEYQIEQSMPRPGIQASYVAWGPRVEGASRELLQDANEAPAKPHDRAGAMLRRQLSADAWVAADVASEALSVAGYSTKQIWAASKKLGVVRQKFGMTGGWYWCLPGLGGALPPPIQGQEVKDSNEASM